MTGAAPYQPDSVAALVDVIAQAGASGQRLELRGGGTRLDFGAPRNAAIVDLTALDSVIDYDPAELVITVGAGARLADVEALLTERSQMLAFEPCDHGPLYGNPAGAGTIGGMVASGMSGSRRLSRGAARDHLLGFTAVSGHGEVFVAGGRVTKNVTGFDLPKLACGMWGRLFALTQVSLKTLPLAQRSLSVILEGLSPRDAICAMSRALGSQAQVAAAAHIPGDPSLTVLRLEGFQPSIDARQAMLEALLGNLGPMRTSEAEEAADLWFKLNMVAPLADANVLWRVHVPSIHSATLLDALPSSGARSMMDWGGNLIWIALETPYDVRSAAAQYGGHATLIRAPDTVRASIPALHPQPGAVATLEKRVRLAYDPLKIFETGRFLDQIDAD